MDSFDFVQCEEVYTEADFLAETYVEEVQQTKIEYRVVVNGMTYYRSSKRDVVLKVFNNMQSARPDLWALYGTKGKILFVAHCS